MLYTLKAAIHQLFRPFVNLFVQMLNGQSNIAIETHKEKIKVVIYYLVNIG